MSLTGTPASGGTRFDDAWLVREAADRDAVPPREVARAPRLSRSLVAVFRVPGAVVAAPGGFLSSTVADRLPL